MLPPLPQLLCSPRLSPPWLLPPQRFVFLWLNGLGAASEMLGFVYPPAYHSTLFTGTQQNWLHLCYSWEYFRLPSERVTLPKRFHTQSICPATNETVLPSGKFTFGIFTLYFTLQKLLGSQPVWLSGWGHWFKSWSGNMARLQAQSPLWGMQ